MKRTAAVAGAIAVAITAIPFITAAQAPRTAQVQRAPVRWQHAYVAFAPYQGAAEIMYVEEGGCRRQVVTVDPVMSEVDRRLIDADVTQGRAVAEAVLLLGNSGWEMIGMGEPYCRGTNGTAMLFKRPR